MAQIMIQFESGWDGPYDMEEAEKFLDTHVILDWEPVKE